MAQNCSFSSKLKKRQQINVLLVSLCKYEWTTSKLLQNVVTTSLFTQSSLLSNTDIQFALATHDIFDFSFKRLTESFYPVKASSL